MAYGLVLQGRQLRASQLQVSRATQLELVKLTIDNPELVAASVDSSDSELTARIGSYLNFSLKQLELSYSVKAISATSVRLQASLLFRRSYPVEWWSKARQVYAAEAATRRERQFFILVDSEYVRAKQQLESAAGEELS